MKSGGRNLIALMPAAAGLCLGACGAFGPPRSPPSVAAPAHYAASEAGREAGGRLPAADGVVQVLDAATPPIPDWWRAFGSATLDAWVAEGIERSPSLEVARNNLKAAREVVQAQVGNSLLPRVDLAAAPSRQRALGLPVLPQETFLYNVFAAEVQTSYTFDFFGAAVLADRSLSIQVREQSYQFEAARRALATNIVISAISAASVEAQLSATERLAALAQERAAHAAARFELGAVSRADLLAAEGEAAVAKAAVPALRAQLLAVRHAQAVLMGRTPDQAPAPLALEELRLPEQLPVSVASELVHRRPDILAAEAAVRAAADAAGAAEAALFPSLTLSAAYGRGGFDWSTFSSPTGAIWNVGATLTQPLLHGGALRARKRQYDDLYAGAVAQYRQVVIAAFQSVADTLVALEEDANALAEFKLAAEAADQMSRDSRARYQLGSSSVTVSLAARQQFESAEVQYLRARAARLADSAALFDAMGAAHDEP